jgi:hypothetical protein
MGLRGCLTVAGRWAGHVEAASECGGAWVRIEGSGFARSGAAFRESVAPMSGASRIGMVDS